MLVTDDIRKLIGKTPMLELKRIDKNVKARILAKMENFNPTSIKDRAVLNMINRAIEEGKIRKNTEVVEASSGNTAIAIASLGVIMGFKARIYMSELCSIERWQVLNAYGAKVVLTPGIEHTKGARKRAIEYCQANPETSYFLNQHDNISNAEAHINTTGPEIWEQTNGDIDAVVIGLGTSGTFEGLSKYFKKKNPDIKIIGFEPKASPVYSGGKQGNHKLIGIGPGFVTENFKRAKKYLDELIVVDEKTTFDWARIIARKEGVFVGISSAASAWTAFQLAKRDEYKNKTIVCFFYDGGERYLASEGLFPADNIERVE